MHKTRIGLVLFLSLLMVFASVPAGYTAPLLTDTPSPEPNVTPTPLPLSSNDKDALLEKLGPEGFAEALPEGEDLLAWVAADLLGNGVDEVAVRTCSGSCEEPGNWSQGYFRVLTPQCLGYTLIADLPVDFTYNFFPGFDVMQILSDGRLGIVEQSACGAHSFCLQVYAWDGSEFRIWEFGGSAGGVAVQPDGTVATGNRDYFTDPISNGFTMVYHWIDDDYKLREVEFEGTPYEGPAGQVRAYFNTINLCIYDGDFHAAYNYLGRTTQETTQTYDDFAAPFANTRRIQVDDLTQTIKNAVEATVQGTITVTKDVEGEEQDEIIAISTHLLRENGIWKLEQIETHSP